MCFELAIFYVVSTGHPREVQKGPAGPFWSVGGDPKGGPIERVPLRHVFLPHLFACTKRWDRRRHLTICLRFCCYRNINSELSQFVRIAQIGTVHMVACVLLRVLGFITGFDRNKHTSLHPDPSNSCYNPATAIRPKW